MSYLDYLLSDVDEASIEHALFQGVANADLLGKNLCRIVAQILPALHGMSILNRPIITLAQGDGLLELQPAAGL